MKPTRSTPATSVTAIEIVNSSPGDTGEALTVTEEMAGPSRSSYPPVTVTARLRRALRHHHQQRHAGVLGSILGQGTQLATDWDRLHMSRQRVILSAVLDHVTLGPGKRSTPVDDRTQLQWRELET
jgi:hypothetical protein